MRSTMVTWEANTLHSTRRNFGVFYHCVGDPLAAVRQRFHPCKGPDGIGFCLVSAHHRLPVHLPGYAFSALPQPSR